MAQVCLAKIPGGGSDRPSSPLVWEAGACGPGGARGESGEEANSSLAPWFPLFVLGVGKTPEGTMACVTAVELRCPSARERGPRAVSRHCWGRHIEGLLPEDGTHVSGASPGSVLRLGLQGAGAPSQPRESCPPLPPPLLWDSCSGAGDPQ